MENYTDVTTIPCGAIECRYPYVVLDSRRGACPGNSRIEGRDRIDMTITVYTKPACVQCNATYKALDKQGIAYETAEAAPGRGNIWARLEGGDQPALVLLHHMDVVPATASGGSEPARRCASSTQKHSGSPDRSTASTGPIPSASRSAAAGSSPVGPGSPRGSSRSPRPARGARGRRGRGWPGAHRWP